MAVLCWQGIRNPGRAEIKQAPSGDTGMAGWYASMRTVTNSGTALSAAKVWTKFALWWKRTTAVWSLGAYPTRSRGQEIKRARVLVGTISGFFWWMAMAIISV